ncbi:MAG: hypothetical protein ACLP7P_09760 [Rhodomicrobium sp.]
MPDQQPANFSISASLSSARAKLISMLIVIALVLGIVTEAISMMTGFYGLRKARCDAAMSAVQVEAHGTSLNDHGPNKVRLYVAECIQ